MRDPGLQGRKVINFSSYPYSAQLGTSTGAHRPPQTTIRRTLIEETSTRYHRRVPSQHNNETRRIPLAIVQYLHGQTGTERSGCEPVCRTRRCRTCALAS